MGGSGPLSMVLLMTLLLVSLALGGPSASALAVSATVPDDSTSAELGKRKSATKVHLSCTRNRLPPSVRFPPPFDERQFFSLTRLCGYPFVGCGCSGESLECLDGRSRYQELRGSFLRYCAMSCDCVELPEGVLPPSGEPWVDDEGDSAADTNTWSGDTDGFPGDNDDHDGHDAQSSWESASTGTVDAGHGPPDATSWLAGPASPRRQCPAALCWHAGHCAQGVTDCHCSAAHFVGDPGHRLFEMRCGVHLTGVPQQLAGRDPDRSATNSTRLQSPPSLPPLPATLLQDEQACPCNCSHVSPGCCKDEAKTNGGIVYESSLGAVAPPMDMCCNAHSGRMDYLPVGVTRLLNDTLCV